MAHIVKIKPSKGYQWEQDHKAIYLKISMPGHISMKNIDIFLGDVMLRITSKQKKSSKILDLAHEIDYLSTENKFTLIDGVVNAVLKKKDQNIKWQTLLIEDVSMEQVKIRRQKSQARYEQNIKQIQENKQKLRNEYDRKATKQLMRFEQQQRNKLQQRKKQEKQQALNQVFRNNNERTGKFEQNGHFQKKAIKNLDNDRQKWEQKGKRALQLLEKQQQQQQRKQKQNQKNNKKKYLITQVQAQTQIPSNSMFTQQDLQKFDEIRDKVQEQIQIEDIPIRKSAKVNLNFSSKPFPNVAARDHHYTQPPMPKQSALFPPTQGDLENKNPLWLKDKGDSFMKDKNYSAAIDAYNQALKIDPNLTKVLMNRSLAFMKTLNLNSCIHDCDAALGKMQKQLTGTPQGAEEAILNIVKINTRKGICLAWKGNLDNAKQLFQDQLEFDVSKEIKSEIEDCIQMINKRKQSLEIKLKADQAVKRQQYEEASNIYDKSINIDGNQYSISNKSLCLNKISEFQESIKNSDQGIAVMNQFGVNTVGRNSSQVGNLYLKLLYRKAKALQSLNKIKEAQVILRKGLQYNPQDKDFKQATKSMKSKQNAQKVASLKLEASNLIKQNRSKEALDIYAACLKMLESSQNTSQYLSILQNQCVCYLKLNQYDSIISTSNRILKLANNLKNRIVDFDRRKAHISQEELKKIMIRTLMRRANAYLKTGRRQNAKSDLEKALEINPQDQTVQKELGKIKQSPAF